MENTNKITLTEELKEELAKMDIKTIELIEAHKGFDYHKGECTAEDFRGVLEYAKIHDMLTAIVQRKIIKKKLQEISESMIKALKNNEKKIPQHILMSTINELLLRDENGVLCFLLPTTLAACEMMVEKFNVPMNVMAAILDSQHFLSACILVDASHSGYAKEYGVGIDISINTTAENSVAFSCKNDLSSKTTASQSFKNKYNSNQLEDDERMIYDISLILNGSTDSKIAKSIKDKISYTAGRGITIAAIMKYAQIPQKMGIASHRADDLLDALAPYKTVEDKAEAMELMLRSWQNVNGYGPTDLDASGKSKSMTKFAFMIMTAPFFFYRLKGKSGGKNVHALSDENIYNGEKVVKEILSVMEHKDSLNFGNKQLGGEDLKKMMPSVYASLYKKYINHKKPVEAENVSYNIIDELAAMQRQAETEKVR